MSLNAWRTEDAGSACPAKLKEITCESRSAPTMRASRSRERVLALLRQDGHDVIDVGSYDGGEVTS